MVQNIPTLIVVFIGIIMTRMGYRAVVRGHLKVTEKIVIRGMKSAIIGLLLLILGLITTVVFSLSLLR